MLLKGLPLLLLPLLSLTLLAAALSGCRPAPVLLLLLGPSVQSQPAGVPLLPAAAAAAAAAGPFTGWGQQPSSSPSRKDSEPAAAAAMTALPLSLWQVRLRKL